LIFLKKDEIKAMSAAFWHLSLLSLQRENKNRAEL